ncbi:hypothetical protein KY320_03415, partial [Candidatus Woesearchaeota archaeon]|nr:hypothetical protein [Candidatus Woesearchaeota archaeon]
MKRVVYALVALLILIGSVYADTPSGRVSESVNVQVSLLTQNPDPVQPGRYVEIRFRAENLGVYNAEDVVFELMPEYPFSLDPSVSARVQVGTLYGRSMGEDAATIYYRVRVDKDAIEGDNGLRLKYSTDGGSSWILLDTFDIRVQTLDAAVDITNVASTPRKIEPGKSSVVEVTVKNLADSLLQDVAVKLDLSDDEMPFVPVNSISEKRIATLGAGQSTVFEFELMAEGDAASQVYKVPIDITYTDE